MVNATTNTSAYIHMNGENLEEVTSFKFLGATLSKDSTSTAKVRIKIAIATAAMARLSRLLTGSSISFRTNTYSTSPSSSPSYSTAARP
ncbi:hypothetical protein DPMN_111603 [Dreissena polymorpha]|uniref:Uncharacterized protein n=1 Tax=Dreissena polymorpha TaxID=45954 RepID=A0A9D4KER8_DREPO|nr:hypothetical protein DPMN_111603 [Dreissena polymorpha]